ncbi:protein ECT2-like, partial [Saccoglossus kowalevskii]|uniref:Protein ECT2-like n=1 Tax=Saccoglossus kowalevskii TaxID=10224 RepID=A0ABM0MXH0_SACKO
MSVINSDSNVKDINQTALETRICVVSDDTANYDGLNQALQELECTVVYSTNGLEYIDDAADKYDTVFVFNNFEGRDYDCLHKMDHRIMGPPVILKCANSKEPLPYNTRPLYCTLMSQLIICFTGFRNKAEITRLVNLVHHMGGSIRKDFSTRVTHLVANTTNGNKYRTAVSLGTPVMTEQWVHQAWSTRHDSTGSAIDEDMMQYKMMPFFCCCLSFMGFSDEEQKHMEEVTQMQGGSSAPVGDKSCTHLVIDDVTVKDLPFECNGKIHIVKSEWFWGSIQMAACADETMYRFTKVDSSDHKTSTPGTPVARSRKRRRLRESIAALSKESEHESPHVPPRKRRSSDMGMLSMSGSFLDASHTPDSSITLRTACTPQSVDTAPTTPPAPPKRIISKREHIAMELLQTESNYVGILHTIIKVFKEPLEQNQTGGPLIPAEDIKTIFGSIPIIYEVHMKLKEDLSELLADYSDDKSIGEIILRHSSGMMKAYPQFVNYFEMTKETVNKCDKQFPRFHAFLKICQSKPECGRQTLCELLIRPVQRLPSMILLLQDLLKRTDSSSPDLEQVEKSITAVKEVT